MQEQIEEEEVVRTRNEKYSKTKETPEEMAEKMAKR